MLLVGAMLGIAALLLWLISSSPTTGAPVAGSDRSASEARTDSPREDRPEGSAEPPTSRSGPKQRYIDATVVEAEGERVVLRPLQDDSPSRTSDVLLLVRHDQIGSFDQTHMQSHIASGEPTRVYYEALNGRRYVSSEQDPTSE